MVEANSSSGRLSKSPKVAAKENLSGQKSLQILVPFEHPSTSSLSSGFDVDIAEHTHYRGSASSEVGGEILASKQGHFKSFAEISPSITAHAAVQDFYSPTTPKPSFVPPNPLAPTIVSSFAHAQPIVNMQTIKDIFLPIYRKLGRARGYSSAENIEPVITHEDALELVKLAREIQALVSDDSTDKNIEDIHLHSPEPGQIFDQADMHEEIQASVSNDSTNKNIKDIHLHSPEPGQIFDQADMHEEKGSSPHPRQESPKVLVLTSIEDVDMNVDERQVSESLPQPTGLGMWYEHAGLAHPDIQKISLDYHLQGRIDSTLKLELSCENDAGALEWPPTGSLILQFNELVRLPRHLVSAEYDNRLWYDLIFIRTLCLHRQLTSPIIFDQMTTT